MTKFPNRKSKEWSTVGIKNYVMLMVEYLRLSPSYSLAHKMATGEISKAKMTRSVSTLYGYEGDATVSQSQLEALLEDFKQVLQTYSEFGDVWSISFDEWWATRGHAIYGYDHEKPVVHRLAQLNQGQRADVVVINAVQDYLDGPRQRQAMAPVLFLAIPLGLPQKQLLLQIKRQIEQSEVPVVTKSKKAKRPLAAERLRSAPLIKGLSVLWGRAMLPKTSLWRLGIKCNVSPKNSQGMHPLKTKASGANLDERTKLGILTHRMFTKSQLTAENAARGMFPSHLKRELPIFDLDDVYARMCTYKPTLKPRVKKTRS